MIPQPETVAPALRKRLATLINYQGADREFLVAALKRDAERLFDVDAISAHSILGGLAALQFDDKSLDRHHQAALSLSESASTHTEYAISLQLAQRRTDAAIQAATAANLDPLDLDMARRDIRYSAVAGQLTHAKEAMERLVRRFPDAEGIADMDVPDLVSILQKWKISEKTVQDCQEVAFAFLRERKLRAAAISLTTTKHPGDECFSYSIVLDAPRDHVFELDRELTDRIWDVLPVEGGNQFWIGFDVNRLHEHEPL